MQVTSEGCGQSAGQAVGDTVMEANRYNVEEKSLEDVSVLVEDRGHSLLVLDTASYNKMKETETPAKDITHIEVTK